MTSCELHQDRAGHLAVHLPSLGIKRYLCDECAAELRAAFAKCAPEVRQWVGWEMSPFGVSYISDSAYHNPNAVYARMKEHRE